VKRNYKRLSKRVLVNLLRAWDAATPAERHAGLTWYATANDYCNDLARRYGVTVEQAAGVVAALSPGLAWELNVTQAEYLVEAYAHGRRGVELPLVGVYGRSNVTKCERILAGVDPLELLSPVTAPKTRAFYRCIVERGTGTDVVIDRHAASAALDARGTKGGSAIEVVKPALYRWLVWHYRVLAERVGITPAQFQAVVWSHWRQSTPGHPVDDLTEVPF